MKISVHAIPHQSFLSIGSEVPIVKKSSFPPGEAKGIVRICPGFHKAMGTYRKPLCDSLRAAWRRLLACMAPAGAQVRPLGPASSALH